MSPARLLPCNICGKAPFEYPEHKPAEAWETVSWFGYYHRCKDGSHLHGGEDTKEEVEKDWNEYIINLTKFEVKKVEIGQLNLF